MAKKVTFNSDYTGRYGGFRKGQSVNVSDEAFADLKSKGIVNVFHEPKASNNKKARQKELKEPIETKELKFKNKETK